MYHLGYYEHYISLKRKYPQFKFEYPRDWSLKEYGTLFIYDQIKKHNLSRVLEMGCGYDTFFAKQMALLGVEYWFIDHSNDYLGIGQDKARFYKVIEERQSYGGKFVDGLLGKHNPELPDEYFDMVFSMSVIEHIDEAEMLDVVEEVKRILNPNGRSAHSIDIYPRSLKAKQWHVYSKKANLEVPLPYYDRWEFDGKYTTFIEQPKIRYMIYNSLDSNDMFNENVSYVSQFATMLSVAIKSELSEKIDSDNVVNNG